MATIKVYAFVSKDKYRHILCLEDSVPALAMKCGYKADYILKSICMYPNGRFERIEIDVDDSEFAYKKEFCSSCKYLNTRAGRNYQGYPCMCESKLEKLGLETSYRSPKHKACKYYERKEQ